MAVIFKNGPIRNILYRQLLPTIDTHLCPSTAIATHSRQLGRVSTIDYFLIQYSCAIMVDINGHCCRPPLLYESETGSIEQQGKQGQTLVLQSRSIVFSACPIFRSQLRCTYSSYIKHKVYDVYRLIASAIYCRRQWPSMDTQCTTYCGGQCISTDSY